MAETPVLVRAAAANAAILGLTSLHHRYGAVRFDTPWRTHVVHLAVWAGLVYEGAYNHVLKNAVYAVSGAGEVFQRMFPPPLYEQPVDWLFELSGVAQLPCGWVATRSALRLLRARRVNGA